jgi:hypothetical protein
MLHPSLDIRSKLSIVAISASHQPHPSNLLDGELLQPLLLIADQSQTLASEKKK